MWKSQRVIPSPPNCTVSSSEIKLSDVSGRVNILLQSLNLVHLLFTNLNNIQSLNLVHLNICLCLCFKSN